MSPLRIVVTLALATAIVAVPVGVARAQVCGAYTDEMAGPDGTFGGAADCADIQAAPVNEVGISVAPDQTTVVGRDDPDAPPVDRDTATYEGERER